MRTILYGGFPAIGWSWIVSAWAWPLDLVANLSAQLLILPVALAVLCVWRRSRIGLGAALIAIAGHVAALIGPGAARAPEAPHGTIRVLMYNAYTRSPSPDAALDLVLRTGADVVALSEMSAALVELVRSSDAIRREYPYFHLPDRAGGAYRLVLSRWPVRGLAPDGSSALHGMRLVVVEHPVPFRFMLVHPDSPRNPGEWRRGNARVREAAGIVCQWFEDDSAPVIVASDFNAAPGGWRSRWFAGQTGLRRCKPVLAWGTYPSGWPAPVRVAIDDVWVSDGIRVASWETLDGRGSDHRPVLVELALPAPDAVPSD